MKEPFSNTQRLFQRRQFMTTALIGGAGVLATPQPLG